MAEKKKYPAIERLYGDAKSLTSAQEKARKELGYPSKRSRKFKVSIGGKTPFFVLAASPKDAVARCRDKLGIGVEELDPTKGVTGIDPEQVLLEVQKNAKLTKEQLEAVRAALGKKAG